MTFHLRRSALSKSNTQLQYQTRSLTQPHPSLGSNDIRKCPPDAQILILPDGRTLGYAEYGSRNGIPLLYFHGFPTSRLEASGLHGITSRLNIRLLSIDRPGFGLSTHDPRRRITDWPADVQAFAAHVGLSRYAILGVSGGGPYLLACAKQLPRETLSAAGVLAGAGVWDRGVRTRGVPWYARFLYLAAKYWPSGVRIASDVLVWTLRWVRKTDFVERKIDQALEAMTKAKAAKEKKQEGDGRDVNAEEGEKQELMPSTAQRRERLMRLIFEGFAQGSSGFVHETRLLTQDWGFKFEDVKYDKVQMWHGSKDANAPVENIRDMAERMPHCVLKEYDENHFNMGNHFEEVLKALIVGAAQER